MGAYVAQRQHGAIGQRHPSLQSDEVRTADAFERHILHFDHWSLDAAFAVRCPELHEDCRFTAGTANYDLGGKANVIKGR